MRIKLILLFFIFSFFLISSIVRAEDKFCVYFFYGKDCLACREVEPFISEMANKYPQINLYELEIWYNQTNRELFFKFCDVYCVNEKLVPIVFIGDKFLIGVEPIKNNLENEIIKCINNSCPCPEEKVKNATVIPKVQLTIPVIISAALIDSINPCAFAVLIFLLTYLIALGSRKKIINIGLAYIFMVFITYFSAGLGIFSAVETIGISSILYKVAAFIAIFAGLINVKDFFFYGKGFSLEIPKSRKPMIEKYIHRASLPAALILGFLVSMFELPCTGGVYLAILSLLANKMTRIAAIPYLFLYNLIFVAPLFIILFLIHKGGGAEKMETWRKSKRKYMKLFAGLFMIALGIIMLLGLV